PGARPTIPPIPPKLPGARVAAPGAQTAPPARPPAVRPLGTAPPATARPTGVATPPAPPRPPGAPPPARPAPAPVPGASATASSAAATPTRAPINPFLANDPNAKARRLSRALVSDLVTYFPQRRDEGLREGTLRELFREEIKKSYEEYVDQVGREFAESTMHFQDALNDILAGGQKIF